jgi:polysaccharide chain length determinant protein (PEP-CTERM system associated)
MVLNLVNATQPRVEGGSLPSRGDMGMDQLVQQARETLRAMWRRRWIGIAIAWVVAIIGGVAILALKDRFEANARVYVDTKTVLRPLMRDLTVEPDLDQTVGLLARTLINRPNVELLIKKSQLETPDMTPLERDRLVETLLRDIKVTGVGRDNVFLFTYRDTSAARARQIVQDLVSLFLESDTSTKRRDAEAAREFIDEQVRSYEARLAEAEDRLKEFKVRNLGVADASGKDYYARMSALTDDMAKLSVELRAAEQARDALRRELGGESTSIILDDAPRNAAIQAPEYDARIEAQKKQLDDLLRRFTEQHPDVISTRHLIARLEEEKQHEVERLRQVAATKPAPASVGSNEGQQRIKLALAESEANVASLRVRSGDMQARLNQLRAAATRVPQIEAELARLNRDYEVIRGTYQSMVARREKAALSEDVDATRSAQFRVIDPPRTSPHPVFPNRLALAPAVLLLAIAAGVLATFVTVQVLPTVDHPRALRLLTQRPLLGSVSMVPDPTMIRRARRNLMGFGSAVIAFVAAGLAWVLWISTLARV